MTTPTPIRAALVAVAVSLLAIGAPGTPHAGATAAAPAVAAAGSDSGSDVGVGDTLPEPNVFLPDERNLSDCLSSLPKPDCGSPEQGGPGQLLTFGALMLGMAFIGWRVFRSVKRRDDAQSPT